MRRTIPSTGEVDNTLLGSVIRIFKKSSANFGRKTLLISQSTCINLSRKQKLMNFKNQNNT